MLLTWQHINATIEAAIERLNDILERSLALKLAMGLWIAIAVPTFLVWMVSQKSVVTAFDLQFLIGGDVLMFSTWAGFAVFFHIRNRRIQRIQRNTPADDEYYCGLHGWVPMSHFPCSGIRESE